MGMNDGVEKGGAVRLQGKTGGVSTENVSRVRPFKLVQAYSEYYKTLIN